jgi:hypothetical protein
MSPNRTNSAIAIPGFATSPYVGLGCMTKTAGPNTACGGTNTSLYMRLVVQIYETTCL